MQYKKWTQWSRERCKFNLIIVARDYNNTMVVNYIYFVLQNHWKGFGMYSFFIHFSEGVVYVYIYVCVCVYIYICSMCMCVCVYIYVYIYMYVYVYTCMYMYMYIYIYVCVCVYEPFKEMLFYRQWYFESYEDEIRNITVDGGNVSLSGFICLAFIKGVLRVGVCM